MSKILLFCGAIITLIGPTLQTTNYCAICENKSHTMCKYKRGPSDKCIGYSSNKLTREIQNLIVGLHNEIRNKVASGREIGKKFRSLPSGTNVHALKWDQELATIAQRWADQCDSILEGNKHDECKSTDRFSVGQNIFQTIRIRPFADFKKFVRSMVEHWYNEKAKVDLANIVRFRGSTNWNTHIGNFAQIVWAETKYIGCAHSSFAINSTSFGILDRLVCNYGPSGNIVGNPIYKAGIPCSNCGCSSKEYPALCGLDRSIRNKRQNIESINLSTTESSSNNSNIYKTDEAEQLNHHLTQKLFQLFEKLNLTINNNLLLQLNDIHNKYNISSEVQDISKHVQEPEDVAYFDELDFEKYINSTFGWEAVGKTKEIKEVTNPVSTTKEIIQPNRKKIKKMYRANATTTTTTLPPKLTQNLTCLQEEPAKPQTYDILYIYQQGDKCFCYYNYSGP